MKASDLTPALFDPAAQIAAELSLSSSSVLAVVELLVAGATVPFIARYRKEATGGLDEVQIRNVEERRTYLIELSERRSSVLEEIEKQGKLTAELRAKILGAASKAELEDLYLPYKPKRRTRAMIARERGLEPLADLLWSQPLDGAPEKAAQAFVSAEKEVLDVVAALAGARDICAERSAEDAELRKYAREVYLKQAVITVKKTTEHAEKVTKFDAYADFGEAVGSIPSHRYLAIRRGETEGVLRVKLDLEKEPLLAFAARRAGLNRRSSWAVELEKALRDGVERLLVSAIEIDVRAELKTKSDTGAVEVFAKNLRQLLLSSPFGQNCVLGVDPGQRTGCKCAVVDDTGKVLEHATLYLVQGDGALTKAKATLSELLTKYPVRAVAVGNGTHGRETESFVKEVMAESGMVKDGVPFCVSVSEAGASVYSASEVAREEFPDLDLTIRGAISIARRLQDPLAELVKLDPKSIGVGQYQHDVFQPMLQKKLDEVVESCVNSVGVELNTASAPLLSRVAGIGAVLARRVVTHRNQHGAFKSRKALLDVPGLGPKTFEQAAGFLRVRGAEHPLDASAVHPERYSLVERMARDLSVPVVNLIGNADLLKKLELEKYAGGDVGSYTLEDILKELQKPGRDPRSRFEPPRFRDDVRKLEDLQPGMALEGVVTNVTAFGAFVDIGVHQDGLVHVSELADRFVKEASEVVKVGDRINVRVLEVDLVRRRIALSAKSGQVERRTGPKARPATNKQDAGASFKNNPFAAHFKRK